MKKTITTIIAIAAFMTDSMCQTILAGGVGTGGMGVASGNTYTKTGTLGSGGFPFVSAAKDGSSFYATGSGKLYFVNGSATSFTDSVSISMSRISSSNEANILFGNTGKALVRVNTATKSVVDSVVLGAPWELSERPNSKEVWVTDSGKVHVVDYTTSLSVTTMAISAFPYDYGKVAFSPGGSMAFKSGSSAKMLYKVDPSAKTIIDSVSTAPFGFSNMVVSDDSSKLFVCNTTNNTVRIYNTSNLTVADSIVCTMTPMNIYRHPSRAEIWVVHHFSDSISVYNENTKALIAAFNISSSPWYLAFGGDGASGIHNYALQSSANLFPNPSHDYISLDGLSAGGKVSVYSITGKLQYTWYATGKQQTFDIADLQTGIYVLEVTGPGNIVGSTTFAKK